MFEPQFYLDAASEVKFRILDDGELAWTERYRGGCWADVDGQLGISLKAFPSTYLDVKPQFLPHAIVPYHWDTPVPMRFSGNTWLPIRVSPECEEVIRKLMGIAEVAEELNRREAMTNSKDAWCQDMRILLNQRYDEFVCEHGLLHNYKKWFVGSNAIWADYRLVSYVFPLETDQLQKAAIFFQRINYPPSLPTGQLFFQEDIGDRVESAYRWCRKQFNRVDVSQIAEKAAIDENVCEDILLYRKLVMRQISPQTEAELTKEKECVIMN